MPQDYLLPVVTAGQGGARSWDGWWLLAARLTGLPSLPGGPSAAASG